MRKIPTLFVRDPDNMHLVLREVNPACQWVLDGQGVATRKYDGTCVMYDGLRWWARREVKSGKQAPAGYVPIETDLNTGKTVGWEPIEQSAFAKFHAQAVGAAQFMPGTYELCGPKINGNPERLSDHQLISHERAEVLADAPRDYEGLSDWLGDHPWEGIVWHHPDGRMAKLKRRDVE